MGAAADLPAAPGLFTAAHLPHRGSSQAIMLKRYKDNLNAYCGKLRDFCVRRGMMHLTIDTNTDLTTLLLDYLRKRGLLK